jgi:hypothetical protein
VENHFLEDKEDIVRQPVKIKSISHINVSNYVVGKGNSFVLREWEVVVQFADITRTYQL